MLDIANLPIPMRLNLLASELDWLRTAAALNQIHFVDITERADVMEACADLSAEVMILADRPEPIRNTPGVR